MEKVIMNDEHQDVEQLFIGLMSGTSIDGLDGVLMSIKADEQGCLKFKTLATTSCDWTTEEKLLLNGLCQPHSAHDNVYSLGLGANVVATKEALAVKQLLAQSHYQAQDICAIGAHGQTICHQPQDAFSLQIDNGPLLANSTDIDAIVNFRAADIANGGQGAPLAQAFHQMVFASANKTRVVLNLGGIANITVLGAQGSLISAFDTGPANTLIDYICRTYLNISFDKDGNLARQGQVNHQALTKLLSHPYFTQPYPKSTGRELFNSNFISDYLSQYDLTNLTKANLCDILATLTELTAKTVIDAIAKVYQDHESTLCKDIEIVACGGGAFNSYLLERMALLAHEAKLNLTIAHCSDFGIDAKFLEAQAFAYFAYCTVHAHCLPLHNSTHASRPSILGCICPAPSGYYARSRISASACSGTSACACTSART